MARKMARASRKKMAPARHRRGTLKAPGSRPIRPADLERHWALCVVADTDGRVAYWNGDAVLWHADGTIQARVPGGATRWWSAAGHRRLQRNFERL